jgi:hypothetical protein
MKKIWRYLKEQVRQDLNAGQYAVVAIFLALSMVFNYSIEFEDTVLDYLEGFRKFYAYFFFYSIPYFFCVVVSVLFKKNRHVFRSREFWIRSIFILLVLSFDSSVPFLHALIQSLFHPTAQFWGYKFTVNMISMITVLVPLFVFYGVCERNADHLYGLNAHRFDTKPYFAMLLIMIPILIAASFHGSFLQQYPMYKSSQAHVHFGVPEWMTVAGYEFAYGLDFITVELVFRGFMVIGMMTVLGRSAILPMAAVYCFLHFGKPAGEAISSIFGGYVLGVIAYETRSVWGGIIVHLGIAWTMEVIGFLHKSL